MKTRKILSKKGKNVLKIDLLMFIICIVIANVKLSIELNTTLLGLAIDRFTMYQSYNFGFALFAFIYILIANFIFKNFFILLFYIPIRISYLSVIKKNKRYEVIDNIEYYREKFEELSPSEISLISDLAVENHKDLSATLLKLYNKNLINFEDNKIIVTSNNYEKLKDSEKYLLDFLSNNNNLGDLNFSQWKNICVNEVLSDGYLVASSNKRKHFWISTMFFILAIYMVIHGTIFMTSPEIDNYMSRLDVYIEQEENLGKDLLGDKYVKDDDSLLENYLKEHPEDTGKFMNIITDFMDELYPLVIAAFELIFGVILIFTIPIYKVIRHSAYHHYHKDSQYIRTNTGKILAEQIAAMQRYIHEFSLLSDTEKEQVQIWDDYLVYAIVLEENEKIIDDIFKYKNIEKKYFYQ